jgi:hypothetical protein
MVIFWNIFLVDPIILFFLLTILDPQGYRFLQRRFTLLVGGVSAVTHLLFRAASV